MDGARAEDVADTEREETRKGRKKNREDTFHYDYVRNGLLIVSAS